MNTEQFNERFDFMVDTIRKAMHLNMHGVVNALTDEFAEFCDEYSESVSQTAAERRHDALRSGKLDTIVNHFSDNIDLSDIMIKNTNLHTGDFQKVSAIKDVRARTGMELKEAKELVEKIHDQIMNIN